jgi:hypothetical protein
VYNVDNMAALSVLGLPVTLYELHGLYCVMYSSIAENKQTNSAKGRWWL